MGEEIWRGGWEGGVLPDGKRPSAELQGFDIRLCFRRGGGKVDEEAKVFRDGMEGVDWFRVRRSSISVNMDMSGFVGTICKICLW